MAQPALRRRAIPHRRGWIKELVGEPGYTVLERTWARPTLDVHGILADSLVPVRRLSFRQGSGQSLHASRSRHDAAKLLPIQKLRAADRSRWRRRRYQTDPFRRPCLIPSTIRTFRPPRARCMKSGDAIPCLSALAGRFRSSATFPATLTFQRDDGIRLPDDNIHAPNEKFNLKNFELASSRSFASLKRLAVEFSAGHAADAAAGFVLAGGQSSRMGSDKALIELNGQPLVVHALNTLRSAGLTRRLRARTLIFPNTHR